MSTPEDEHQDGFNEDFDFGEDDHNAHPINLSPKQGGGGPNKNLLVGLFAVVVVVIVVLGYKFYGSSSKKTAANSQVLPVTTPQIAKKEGGQPAVTPQSTTAQPSSVTKPTTSTSLAPATPAQEQNFGEIAQAFSSADHPATPPASTPAHTAHPVKEGTIQDLQKELFAPESQPAKPTETNLAATPVTKPETVKQAHTAPTATSEATHAAQTEASTTQLAESLNKLNQQIDYISNKIKYLDSYTREVSDNLNKLNDTLNSMDHRVSTLTNTTSSLSKDVGNVRNEVGHVREVLREDGLELTPGNPPPPPLHKRRASAADGKIAIEEPEYFVHAVIPGRAWLKSPKGQILTVTEGDTIGNYGKILVIDAANGVVLTSSGVTFR